MTNNDIERALRHLTSPHSEPVQLETTVHISGDTGYQSTIDLLIEKGDVLEKLLGNACYIVLDKEYDNKNTNDVIIAALAEWEKAKGGIK